MIFEYLDEDTVYEVLISTYGVDGFNIKPFGMRIMGDNVVLRLYPNHTLFNIKKSNTFTLHFTQDVLVYTRAFFGLLGEDVLDSFSCSVECDVIGIDSDSVEDNYGKNITTTIIAKPVKITENNKGVPTINRATNKIIELLVDYSRYKYMDVDEKQQFIKKLEITEKFIQKNSNKKHTESIKIIKKRIKS